MPTAECVSDRPTEAQLLTALAFVDHVVGSDPGMVLALLLGMISLTVERCVDPSGTLVVVAEQVHAIRRLRAEQADRVS